MSFFEYVSNNYMEIFSLFVEHIKLTAIAVLLAIAIGVPVGILISYVKKASKPVLSITNIIQAIPSMALLGFMIPLLGIGETPSIVVVILYSLLPIIKNTYIGINNINPSIIESAKGIGLKQYQILGKIQIPLALPVIMAGVRIASVTAVGLMTIAAYIGAGGLGKLVFAGIRTVNNAQILAGAIPACILALLVDAILGFVERMVTPKSLQKGYKETNKKVDKIKKITLAVVTLVIAALIIVNSVGAKKSNSITVGAKDYTEQVLVGHMVADVIEDKTDLEVERKFDLGGTQVIFGALQKGDVDLYVEYSGTAYTEILKHNPISDLDKVYNVSKKELEEKYKIKTLDLMTFNDTYALTVTKETAKKYNLKTCSDLAKVAGQLTSGTTFEFMNRKDGLPGLQKAYNIKFKESKSLDSAPRYTALDNGEVDVIDAFTTDGLIKKFDLVVLEDDKKFFPPYNAMPLVRPETLKEHPEIVPILNDLGKTLTNDVMAELNYQVDVLQKKPADVARNYLKSNKMIK